MKIRLEVGNLSLLRKHLEKTKRIPCRESPYA